jgi:hypothetical protein
MSIAILRRRLRYRARVRRRATRSWLPRGKQRSAYNTLLKELHTEDPNEFRNYTIFSCLQDFPPIIWQRWPKNVDGDNRHCPSFLWQSFWWKTLIVTTGLNSGFVKENLDSVCCHHLEDIECSVSCDIVHPATIKARCHYQSFPSKTLSKKTWTKCLLSTRCLTDKV